MIENMSCHSSSIISLENIQKTQLFFETSSEQKAHIIVGQLHTGIRIWDKFKDMQSLSKFVYMIIKKHEIKFYR